jgi:hypothetical protein
MPKLSVGRNRPVESNSNVEDNELFDIYTSIFASSRFDIIQDSLETLWLGTLFCTSSTATETCGGDRPLTPKCLASGMEERFPMQVSGVREARPSVGERQAHRLGGSGEVERLLRMSKAKRMGGLWSSSSWGQTKREAPIDHIKSLNLLRVPDATRLFAQPSSHRRRSGFLPVGVLRLAKAV